VGCTSGYKSNPEKVTQFCVPKDFKRHEVWAKAIPNKDFILTENTLFVSNISVKMTL